MYTKNNPTYSKSSYLVHNHYSKAGEATIEFQSVDILIIQSLMRTMPVHDSRKICEDKQMKEVGLRYYSILKTIYR